MVREVAAAGGNGRTGSLRWRRGSGGLVGKLWVLRMTVFRRMDPSSAQAGLFLP